MTTQKENWHSNLVSQRYVWKLLMNQSTSYERDRFVGQVWFSLTAGPSTAVISSWVFGSAFGSICSREPMFFPLVSPQLNKKGFEKPNPFSATWSPPDFQYCCHPREPRQCCACDKTWAFQWHKNNTGEYGNLFAFALRLLGWVAIAYCRRATRCDSVHRAKQLTAQLWLHRAFYNFSFSHTYYVHVGEGKGLFISFLRSLLWLH